MIDAAITPDSIDARSWWRPYNWHPGRVSETGAARVAWHHANPPSGRSVSFLVGGGLGVWMQVTEVAPAWHGLVEAHMHIVRRVARHLKYQLPSFIDIDDLQSAGYEGLVYAARCYRSERKCSFRTYATRRIWGAMVDFLRRQDHIDRLTRIAAKREGTEHRLPMVVSLDEPQYHNDQTDPHTWKERIRAPNGCPVTELSAREWPAVYFGLSPAQQCLIHMKYREGKTLKQVGIHLGISESRVCQLHRQALDIWREWIEARVTVEMSMGAC